MKVLLYNGGSKILGKSGIGEAIKHQKSALERNNIDIDKGHIKDADIVQINTVLPDSVAVALMSKLQKKKIVYYGHSTMEDFKNSFVGSNIMAPLFKKWITLCYNFGDVIITPTDYSKSLLDTYGLKSEVFALSNGIDLDYFNKSKGNPNVFREKYGLSSEDKVIISVGHYIERKGIVEFVELAEKLPQYKFIWFGHTSDSVITKKVKKAINTKLPNLIFPGFVGKNELRDALSGADLFLFLSHEETEGIVTLEAMAMEIPIVLRDIPVYEGWVLDGCNAHKALDEPGFIDKIEYVLNNSQEEVLKSAYETASLRDVKVIGKELSKIYNKLVS